MQPDLVWIALIGSLSGALYGVIYFTQQAIFLNGLLSTPGAIPPGHPADSAGLLFQLSCYCLATIALFALYGWLLVLCRQGKLHRRKTRILALLFPLFFNLGLWLGRPYVSIDLFNYMSYGYLGNLPGDHPYLHAARDAIHTPLGQQLVGWGWRPVHGLSPYGPVWTQVERVILKITPHIPSAMLLFKGVIIAASLGSAALIWAILRVVRPADQWFGVLVYLWNPIIVMELAGEGHNDALLLLFVLAALAGCVYAYAALSILFMTLAVLTKYLPIVFFPPLLVYLWHARRSDRHFLQQLLWGAGLGFSLGLLLYRTPEAVLQAVQGLQMQTQLRSSALPAGIVFWVLSSIVPLQETGQLAAVIWKSLVSALIGFVSWHSRNLTRLFKALSSLSLVLLLASPIYWSWY
ncbi:MAG TPA: hypothetical protein V6C57_13060, partial [Coleofasciculaceae cyanobacterium]